MDGHHLINLYHFFTHVILSQSCMIEKWIAQKQNSLIKHNRKELFKIRIFFCNILHFFNATTIIYWKTFLLSIVGAIILNRKFKKKTFKELYIVCTTYTYKKFCLNIDKQLVVNNNDQNKQNQMFSNSSLRPDSSQQTDALYEKISIFVP